MQNQNFTNFGGFAVDTNKILGFNIENPSPETGYYAVVIVFDSKYLDEKRPIFFSKNNKECMDLIAFLTGKDIIEEFKSSIHNKEGVGNDD